MKFRQFLLCCDVCITAIVVSLGLLALYIHPTKNGLPITLRSPGRMDYSMSMNKITKYRSSTCFPGTRYKWLFLCTHQTYHSMMNRHYFFQYYAAQRHPNIDPTLWGIGFLGQYILLC